jgi:hypothetical protein
LPQETKDKLFITSLENVEYSLLLETEARTMKWGWLFRTYVQWHAIAFLLSELCVRTKGEAVDRAWRAIEATAGRWWFPLNDANPHVKGQQGCLWKPLKKLLAKARCARERELALQSASLALRNGQFTYPGFTQGIESLPPLSANQPDSENLDRLLRPSAPKLGDWANELRESGPGSSQLPDRHALFHEKDGSTAAQPQRPNGAGLNRTQGIRNSPGQQFHELTNFGLDNVLSDVMSGTDLRGNEIFDFNDLRMPTTNANLSNQTQPNGLSYPSTTAAPVSAYDTANAIVHAHGAFGDASLFSNVDFANLQPDMGNGTNGQPSDSPILDGGGMDWTQWDDLVTQFGMEGGGASHANGNPASQPFVNWF